MRIAIIGAGAVGGYAGAKLALAGEEVTFIARGKNLAALRHKTSMLQDVEAGRDPELDALVGSVIELGRLTGTPTPHIDGVYALTRLLALGLADARAAA
jgi:ketopantoate reductase